MARIDSDTLLVRAFFCCQDCMSEPTAGVDAPAPATPDPATIASLADYEAARPQLLKDSATPPERGESADTIRERLLTEQDTRVQRDQRGRFTKAAEAAPALQDVPEKAADATATTTPEPAPPQTTRKNPQDRIAHVVWEREQARREAAALRAQLEALQAPAPMAAAPAAPEPPAMDPPPSSKPAPDYGDPRDPQPSEDQFQT
ncbi:MAG: hypothetical protein VW405_10930, partial [Rhodospirillaceae bacterium]